MSVGVMKDYNLKLRNLHVSYTYTGLVVELEHLVKVQLIYLLWINKAKAKDNI